MLLVRRVTGKVHQLQTSTGFGDLVRILKELKLGRQRKNQVLVELGGGYFFGLSVTH